MIEANGSSVEEMKKRLSSGRKVLDMLNSVMWSSNIQRRTEKLIYSSVVVSILLYGGEICTISKTN